MIQKTIIEPFKIKMVEPVRLTTFSERKKFLKQAYYNPFLIHSRDVLIDLLTDSGTSAMSSNQWAGIMMGDESYAGAESWEKMHSAIHQLTGYPYILPTHQGRAAERILYGYLGNKTKTFISNSHFDTTRANIEFSGSVAIDCPVEESAQITSSLPFKGNMDVEKMEKIIKEKKSKNIGAVILTVTNNSGGGQPVSMENAKAVSRICKKSGVLFVLDACRIAENSYFIKHNEKGFVNKTYRQIAQEMFSLADGCIMSAKKDALVNTGGFLALKEKIIADACTNLLIITEGYTTYGGLSGRDMETIAIGLKEIFESDYLTYRIRSTAYFGEKLFKMGVPVMMPIGGHAVYVDAKTLYPHIAVEQYPGQTLVCELYLKGGIRCCEIGSVMFGKYDKKGKLIPARMELVRLALPRRVYTQSHIDYAIETFVEILNDRKKTKGLKIVYEPKILRHFSAHFEMMS